MHLQILTEQEMTVSFFAIALLLLFGFLFGKIFELLHAPKVIGEIVGGMVLGSTCLHYFFPDAMEMIFKGFPEEGKILNIFYQLGLVFLMFASGLNTQIDINKKNSKLIGILFVGAMVIPFFVGLFLYRFFISDFMGEMQHIYAFIIVFLISLTVTSIPVISKIFFDLKLINTNFSNVVLTVATIKDLCLWIFLNLAIAMVTGKGQDLANIFLTVGITIFLFVLARWFSRLKEVKLPVAATSFCTLIFSFLFFVISILSNFQINIMYSAFIVGYAVKFLIYNNKGYIAKIENLSDVAFSFFIPNYFALVGIQLNLIHDFSLRRFLLYFFTAFSLEFFSCFFVLQFMQMKKMAVLNFSIVMNARGGPGIVLATVGYYYKIINIEFFTVLILTTMISSAIAGYWLNYQKKRDITIFNDMKKP